MPASPPTPTTGAAARHQRLAELSLPLRGWLADLGCGGGATLAHLVPHARGGARLLGVDRDLATLAQAGTAGGRVALVAADLSGPLPIATGAVDRVVCHDVLECLPDPAAALAEVGRILRRGGRAVIGHSDDDTLVWAGADLALTRRLVHAYCDTRQGWMDAVDGTLGRRLPALVADAGLRADRVEVVVVLEDAFAPGPIGYAHAGVAARIGARAGACTQTEADGWLADLATAHDRGRYLFSVDDDVVVAGRAAGGAPP